ncbi:2-succinyl-6-hydroxy-2,4-cyclohexadiene-1-carboxylate synthase [Thermogemmatispora sp.]|uniref:2-succinyl-6-hydroxy-2, 4-cyclohexadiene-1-carboxylate synthase n=1 Tax=Thermogemmatispora sp. TaxID=1968838 RepID=UPI001E0FDFC2|nr:2-succinyl-6-hydroxy-2,4-cyclohexadiene-1-carboxylate synthase [Thermogemmatispora sp.]MBX5449435.1 2-succinyl-6-hydroxy-2,4-cyclohexadiene-1-carboxylate synthase [Thermogemmatispora sp.]
MKVQVERLFLQVNGLHLSLLQLHPTKPQNCPVLVLLHGFTGSALGWGSLLEELATAGLSIVALDLHGHGLSDAPSDPERYSMEHCRADLLEALRQLGIAPGEAILLGYSLGGRIALYCAFSGFFRALILESASAGIADPQEREERRRQDEELAASIEREGVAAFVARWEQQPLFASQQRLPEELRAALRAQRLANRAEGLAGSLRGVGTGVQPPLYARLPELQLPVLLICGALDEKFCAIGREMAALLPQARLAIVPEAGHTVHLEQPARFLELVLSFCSALSISSGSQRNAAAAP